MIITIVATAILGVNFDIKYKGGSIVDVPYTGEVNLNKAENVIEDTYIAEQRNIIFDDETLSVSYQTENDTFLNGVLDIMPAFIIIGGCICLAVLVISVIVYYSNKKRQDHRL